MAATDQAYRNQYTLDIVFAVSSILMLASIVWMLVDDYRREYKVEQRIFRDVEVGMAQREAIKKMPRKAAFLDAKDAVDKAGVKRKENQSKIADLNAEIAKRLPEKERADLALANFKAEVDSRTSFYDIAVDNHGVGSEHAIHLKEEVSALRKSIADATNTVEDHIQGIKKLQREKDELERPLTKAIGELKKLLDDFDRQVNLSVKKQWGIPDAIRNFWFIDGYASPTKIEQITLRDLTIDYNFMGVTRFDRCTTCHKGIARPTFTKDSLEELWYTDSPEMKERLEEAKWILTERKNLLVGLDEGRNLPEAGQLKLQTLNDKRLTQARINEFAAHPRLDLYAASTSKHPAEKFGCTSCHGGQPSGTDFKFAAHTPNDSKTLGEWKKEHDWQAQHDWDFPMNPKRFTESSCLKCHYQVTDLYSDGDKSEAPKLLKGYNLIREYGCFGCHEISGFKSGRQIGPDLRLEPNPPLDKLTPAERAKLSGDPDNPPGTMRKVAPNLYRLSEKTNEEWAVKWVMAPREFRPSTKMPHYYGLSNNDAKALEGTGQDKFPATEVHGIVHYLFNSSRAYLTLVDESRQAGRVKEKQGLVKELEQRLQVNGKLTKDDAKKLQDATFFLSLQTHPMRLGDAAIKEKGDAPTGRDLFSKKGCLACHSHAGTAELDEKNGLPALPSEADFGPDLTQVKGKLVPKDGNLDKATIWLINWLKNPTNHSPRTRMPITHLTDKEAADIASWLLSQEIPGSKTGSIPEDLQGSGWSTLNVPAPTEAELKDLAKVYLQRTLADSEVKRFFNNELSEFRIGDLGADEKDLSDLLKQAKDEKARKEALLHFAGKKAIGRLGCYACHEIPGFDNAKPIGTALADWGKKDPGRLAFEDIASYVKLHYPEGQVVDSLVDEDGYPRSVKKGELYETFFYNALMHQSRDGYLNQKLLEPRSYDYGRIRAWDDRSRMPQFKFARVKMKAAEDPDDFAASKSWAEAMGRAVDGNSKPRPAESADDFKARKELQEAKNREAVMTFVLGLVADPMPLQYLNQPSPDRLAEIKGRQVLDKFNCAGCHVLRPGVFEFKMSKRTKDELEATFGKNIAAQIHKDDHVFADHRAWSQPAQTGGIAVAHGVRPTLSAKGKTGLVKPILTESLVVPGMIKVDGKDKSGDMAFRSGEQISLPPRDLIWPPQSALRSTDAFRAWEKDHGTQGGEFAALLSNYLKDEFYKDKKFFKDPGISVPPQLLWEGERTQPDWLYQFLLDPSKIREKTVLRMPKFNMSEDEAKALVDYFGAVERRFNPDVDPLGPYSKIPERAGLDTDYWKAQTARYIANLKKSDQYQKEVDGYKPIWDLMLKDLKEEAASAEKRSKAAATEAADANKAFEAAKDDKQKEAAKKDADLNKSFWESETKRLAELAKKTDLKTLEEEWSQTEAYALAGYRLLVNQCNQCHTVGNITSKAASTPEGQSGPSLNLASGRLRPDWAKRWIANPQRFVSYTSVMPAYFKKSENAPLVPWLPGSHFEQIEGARDSILNLPRIQDLPMTRYWLQSGAK